jgi:hypothetical protein
MFERLTRWENNDKDVADLIEEKSDFDGLTEAINRLAAYEDSGLLPEDILGLKDYGIRYTELEKRYREALKEADDLEQKLNQYNELAKAKADGRLVVLPCKVGSDLWSIERARTKCTAHGEEYSEYSCQGCEEPCDSVITQKIRRVKEASHMTIAHFMQSGCFGKTVFLTREAAEKALEVGE